MKWGVRKATIYGETRDKVGDDYTDRQKKHIRSQAQSILKKKKKSEDSIAEIYGKAAMKAQKKADNLVWKSEARQKRGDQTGFQKYQSKAWKQIAKYIEYKNTADGASRRAQLFQARLNDISQEKIKAGQNYVTNIRFTDSFLLPYYQIDRRIDFEHDN